MLTADCGLKMFCKEVVGWRSLRHPNVLPLLGAEMTETRFTMVSEWMVNGTITEFVNAHVDADRMELLRDVTRGVIYMHDQGIVHGGLKGPNILIDNNGHACLTDFGSFTIVADQPTDTASYTQGGTIRWMSPELLNPEEFSLKDGRPTKEADCYALGMVIYEVLSGHVPFAQYRDLGVVWRILKGERPERPRGKNETLFTDDIWGVSELCWAHQPRDRLSASGVLVRLEGHLPLLRLSSNLDGGAEIGGDGGWESGSGDQPEPGSDGWDTASDCRFSPVSSQTHL